MRRISALALAVLLVLVSGCSDGGAEKGEPSAPTPTLLAGVWTGQLNSTAVKVAKQIIAFREQGQPVPKNLGGFELFLTDGQSFDQYQTDGTEFSFCVLSTDGWVAFDSKLGGTVAFGKQGPCAKAPMDEVVAARQAAADLAVKVDEAAQQEGDPFDNLRAVFDNAELPAGLSVGATDIGYRVARFCVQTDYDIWAAYSDKAPTEDHLAVGIVGGC